VLNYPEKESDKDSHSFKRRHKPRHRREYSVNINPGGLRMKHKVVWNTTNLLISLVLLGLFVLLGTLSFQADAAPGASQGTPIQQQSQVQAPSATWTFQP
jgi:hypothetical protein